MQSGMSALIREGQIYSKTWPLRPELAAFFIEFRVIKATRLGINLLPLIAVISLFVQVKLLGHAYLPQAIAAALLILGQSLSLPITMPTCALIQTISHLKCGQKRAL